MLLRNQQEQGGRCQLGVEGVCTGVASVVHHKLGRARTGDDERFLEAVCAECNAHVGDPLKYHTNHRPISRW